MVPPPSPPEDAASDRLLIALTAAAFVVRAAFLLLEPATHYVGDELTWTQWARELSSPRVGYSPLRIHMIFYPPVYPYFLAVFYGLTGAFEAAKWAQVALGSLLVPAVGRVGERVFSRPVGLAAAAITAFYPELVWFSAHFWSETLFLVLLWWSMDRLLSADEAGAAWAAGAGALWGLTTLTRETVLYFVPLAAVWLAFRRGRAGALRGAAFLLAAILVIAPWTYRNWLVFHAFVPVSTAGGQNLFQGNALIPRDETYAMVDTVQGRIAQYRYAMGMGLQAIRDRQPWWIFEKLRAEMPRFWEADSLVLIHIKRGAYGDVTPWIAVGAAVIVLAPYLAVLAFFTAGVVLLRDRRQVFLILFLGYYILIHIVTHGFARYRLPVMPVVFLFAALGFWAWRAGVFGGMSARRRAAAALLVLVLGATLVPSFRQNLEHPAFGFADTGGPPGEESP